MTRRFRFAALHLAIIAMLLRALLPAGWMPGPDGAALTICTLDGHHAELAPSGKPGPDDSRHAHEECPFAAAPHVAAPVVTAAFSRPSLSSRIDRPDHVAVWALSPSHQPQSPRAPPHFA